MFMYCLGDRCCIVKEKRGGAPCRVKLHRKKPGLRYDNGSGKVIKHHTWQTVITSRGSPLVHAYHIWSTTGTRSLVLLTERTNDRMTDGTNENITPPALAEL